MYGGWRESILSISSKHASDTKVALARTLCGTEQLKVIRCWISRWTWSICLFSIMQFQVFCTTPAKLSSGRNDFAGVNEVAANFIWTTSVPNLVTRVGFLKHVRSYDHLYIEILLPYDERYCIERFMDLRSDVVPRWVLLSSFQKWCTWSRCCCDVLGPWIVYSDVSLTVSSRDWWYTRENLPNSCVVWDGQVIMISTCYGTKNVDVWWRW
jgi:hypothetical protein